MSLIKQFSRGIWKENPVLVLLLGMCPTLAVTGNAVNGLGMGVATTFVLIGSNFVVSLIKKFIPKKVRIPCYIVIIATFVTIIEMLMKAYTPTLNESLGIFIPLIVVNCIVLGRAEAFASKNSVLSSLFDAFGMGLGFILALVALGGVREFCTSGSFFTIKLITSWPEDKSFMLMNQAPGAFIVLGLFLAGMNWLNIRKAEKNGERYTPPADMDCRHCNICDLGNKKD